MEETRNYERRLQLREVNPYLICVLCGGYFVDAASIVECLHTFCWTCIVKYLEKNKFCPICDVQAYKNKPHLSIRRDDTIQRLTYKMVPGLFASEIQRRKEFYLSSEPPTTAIHLSPTLFFPDESISLSLEYYEAGNNNNDETCHLIGKDPSSMKMKLVPHKRYLQCPAAVTVNHLKKFVRMKYGLAAEQLVDIIYQEECLPENFSLMDVAYTFMWDRKTPMRFSYRILERAAVPAESKSDINGAHGYSAPRSQSKKNNWSQNDPTSSSGNGTTNAASGRQLRGNVFRKRKSDSGNESYDASTKDEESDELDNLSLLKRLRVRARQQRLTEKGASSPRRGSRSSSRKLRKRRKTVVESETPSDYSTATSPDYPGSSIPTNNDDDDSLDDYTKYEDDIEEITDDFDDEDDEGRLWISPIEDEATEKDSEGTSQEGSVNNDGDEEEKKTEGSPEESSDRYSLKLKKKSKKGKHHHHHHHHKHHDRHVKKAPPATILKSSDTDIMKLKVKLNPIVSCEKYHKSSGKPKLIGEVVSSANSNVSTTADTYNSNADKTFNSDSSSILRNETSCKDRLINTDKSNPNISSSSEISSSTSRTSRNDEASCGSFYDDDSQNSNGSEENADLNHAKSVINDDPGCQLERETEVERVRLKEKKKEQSFRPVEVPRCKPNFLDTINKSNPPPLLFTNSDSNSSRSKSPLLHPPSSITVSKITAAEKRKLDENKLLNNNLDSKTADSLRPSLEIMLINGPKMQSFFRDELKKGSPRTKSGDGSNSKIQTSPASTSVSVSASSSSSPSSSCALSTSPLVRLQKMSINLPSVTVTHSTSTQKPYTTKTVVQNGNEPRIQAGSIEISLQKENTAPKRSEDRERKKVEGVKKGAVGETAVLDLSSTGKLLKPTVSGSATVRTHQPDQSHQSSPSPRRPKSAISGLVKQQIKVSAQLVKPKSGSEKDPIDLPVSMQNLTILSNAAAHIESRFAMQNAKPANGSVNPSLATSVNVRSSPVPSTQKKNQSVGNVSSSSQQSMSLKIPSLQQRPISYTKQDTAVPRSMPKLNEIDRKQFIRSIPHSNTANGLTTTKPGQNQFVRHITDPSTMIYARQQNAAVVSPITSSSVSSFVKKYAGVNNGRLSSPPAAIPIASMLRQGVISRDIEKVTAGLQMKATATAELASVK